MTGPRWWTRTSRRTLLATAATVALLAGGCGQTSTTGDGQVRLTSPPCEDEGACAEEYEFDGRRYGTASSDLTDADVAELAVERFEVDEPEGIDELVTTDDPELIYLRTDAGWIEGRA